MNWEEICQQIPQVTGEVRKEYTLQNNIIKDDIFRILEKHCEVVYYPFEDEQKTRGFHIKRFMKGTLVDFVYINTAKPAAEQIFGAAHELGHVWRVAYKIWERLGYESELTEKMEERIVNRFAAELMMPEEIFRNTFFNHIDDLGLNSERIKFGDVIRVMVMQMSDYMVPFEAIRRRLVETCIVTEETGELLHANRDHIDDIVEIYSKELNATFSNPTMKKTIPGLRDAIAMAEKKGTVSEFVLSKAKNDFSLDEVNAIDETITISREGK